MPHDYHLPDDYFISRDVPPPAAETTSGERVCAICRTRGPWTGECYCGAPLCFYCGDMFNQCLTLDRAHGEPDDPDPVESLP
jgi:hypothetical protein